MAKTQGNGPSQQSLEAGLELYREKPPVPPRDSHHRIDAVTESDSTGSQQNRAGALRVGLWILLAATIAVTIFVRVRFIELPLERDEGEYAYAGQLLLQGIAPYQLAYSMKFPGTSAAYAAVMSVFGQTTSGIHLGLLCINLATAYCVFLLGRRLLGTTAGALAACFYGVLSLSPWVAGLCAHATHFVMLAVLAGALLLLRPVVRIGHLVAAGLLFGMAILMKQPGALFVPLGWGAIFLADRRASLNWPRMIARNLIFTASVITPIAAMFLILWRAGVLARFWSWTVDYSRSYGSMLSLSDGAHLLTERLPSVVGPVWMIWVLAAVGVLCVWTRAVRPNAPFLSGLLVCSAAAVCPGFYFREHYFILLLPAVALLAAVGVTALVRSKPTNAIAGYVMLLLAATALALPLWRDRALLFNLPPAAVSQALYWPNPFAEAIRVSQFIRERTNAGDTIAVLGSEPEIYFYAQRHSATGYIYTYPLMEPYTRAPAMQREMIDEIERAHPKYVVVIGVEASWLRRPASDPTIFNWTNEYCANEFTLVGSVNLLSPERADFSLPATGPVDHPAQNYVFVYERRVGDDQR